MGALLFHCAMNKLLFTGRKTPSTPHFAILRHRRHDDASRRAPSTSTNNNNKTGRRQRPHQPNQLLKKAPTREFYFVKVFNDCSEFYTGSCFKLAGTSNFQFRWSVSVGHCSSMEGWTDIFAASSKLGNIPPRMTRKMLIRTEIARSTRVGGGS